MSAGSAARTRLRAELRWRHAWCSGPVTDVPEGSGPFASHGHAIRFTLLPATP